MGKFKGRPKKHPAFNKGSRSQRIRRAKEKMAAINSLTSEEFKETTVFDRSGSVEANSFMPEVMSNVSEKIESFVKVKNETDSLITTIKAHEQQQGNPLITSIQIKEENVEPDLASCFPSTHQNYLITPNTVRIVNCNSLITSIETEEENLLISTIETHKRKKSNVRRKKKNKVITSFQTEEENMTDEQTKDLIVRFSRMYQNMLKVFFESKDDCHLMKCLRTFLQENEGLNNAESIVRFFESCRRKHQSDPPDLILHSARMHQNSLTLFP